MKRTKKKAIKPMKKSNIQLHTNKYSTKLTCCQVYNPLSIILTGALTIKYPHYQYENPEETKFCEQYVTYLPPKSPDGETKARLTAR